MIFFPSGHTRLALDLIFLEVSSGEDDTSVAPLPPTVVPEENYVLSRKTRNIILRSASTDLTLYCRCVWTTDTVSVDCLSVLRGLRSCARHLGAASVLSPAQRTAPLLPPAAPDISYRSHYSPQEVVQSFLHPTSPHLHLLLIRAGETSNPY